MKHLFVTQDFGPDLGGMARWHVELCRRFAPDAVVVSTVTKPNSAAFDAGEPYAIVRQPFSIAGARLFPNKLRWAQWLARAGRDGVDVIHCGNSRPTGYPVRWAQRLTGVPYLLYVNGGDMLHDQRKIGVSRLQRATRRATFARAAGIVAISDWAGALAGDVMQHLGISVPPPVTVIPLGTDPDHFHPGCDRGALRDRLGLGDAPLLLTVARLVPHKGQDIALRALALLRNRFPALRYLLVGAGPDETRLRALARALGVESAVIFGGALSDDDIAEAYATATVYVGLSRVAGVEAEGFGISFSEAAASALPAVAGDSGGVRSAVRDGETGLLVQPEDPSAVVAAIRVLLEDAPRRQAMGRAARQAALTHYNWDRVAEETKALARIVTNQSARSAK